MDRASSVLDLSRGSELVVDGVLWCVDDYRPHLGEVVLRGPDAEPLTTSVRNLINHPGVSQSTRCLPGLPAASRGRQPKALEDLTDHQRELVALRVCHLNEVATGYRSGSAFNALANEPRPHYDPAATGVEQRRRAKAAELAALKRSDPEHARALGLDRMSFRSLERMGANLQRLGPIGCADDRWLRRTDGHNISPELREAIIAVREETLHRSKVSMATKARMINQYVRERFGPATPVPSYFTLRIVWMEWFGPGGERQRYARSAARAKALATGEHVVMNRPGQVLALDTTVLPVKVREGVFGDPVSVHMTLGLDVYTHSLVAFRLTLVSDLSVDVAMLLRDVMTPLPMREGWGEEIAWPYPGIPAGIVADLAGYPVAGLPFFAPTTVTTDHGTVYKNHQLIRVQRLIGANVLPSRVLRPTDKQAVERAFGGIRSLLFEELPGYTGVDPSDRGVDAEVDAALTIAQMEHLIATWIVTVWQNRRLGEYAPYWDPGGHHSPNTLFAAAMAQGGFSCEIPKPELFYELLPPHHVKVHGKRGAKILGLWYDGPALNPCRQGPSTRGGYYKGQWKIHHDPRDRRTVFFQDPFTHDWHPLRWTGLPPEGEVPCFADTRVEDLLAEAKQAKLYPKHDRELLPLLLALLGAHTPVDEWHTQMDKRTRTAHSREEAQAAAAAADRPGASSRNPPAFSDSAVNEATPERAMQAQNVLDAERRHRRERAIPAAPTPPPARAGNLFDLFNLPRDTLATPAPLED